MKTKILNLSYSIGASIVIFGAWSKIEHFSFADTALTAGLLTEVVIFLIYGLQSFTGEPEPIDPGHAPGYPTQKRLEGLIEQTNAILRDVYKTSK
jgi:hypothetical protein